MKCLGPFGIVSNREITRLKAMIETLGRVLNDAAI